MPQIAPGMEVSYVVRFKPDARCKGTGGSKAFHPFFCQGNIVETSNLFCQAFKKSNHLSARHVARIDYSYDLKVVWSLRFDGKNWISLFQSNDFEGVG